MAEEMIKWLMTNDFLLAEDFDETQAIKESRDSFITEADVDSFIDSKKKKNTVAATARDVRNVQRWLQVNKNEERPLEVIPTDELNLLLSQLWLSIRKTDGSEYEPGTLNQIKNSVDRYLKEKSDGKITLRSKDFDKSDRALIAKKQDLKQQGLGRRAHKALAITENEEEVLWSTNQLGCKNPASLQFSMFYFLSKCMGFRGRENHRRLQFGDICLKKDIKGVEFLEYHERESKMMDGKGRDDYRPTVPRIYSNGIEGRDPVQMYKTYVSHRPFPAKQQNSPFYLTLIPVKRINGHVWYYPTPLGEGSLGNLLKRACTAAGIPGKKTNHSLRKTTVKTLQRAKAAPHKIIQVTGHRSIASLKSYDDELEEAEQKEFSDVLSTNTAGHSVHNKSSTTSCSSTVATYTQSSLQATCTQSSSSSTQSHFYDQLFTGATLNECKITLNVMSRSMQPKSPPQKRRRIKCIIDSDSSQEFQ